VTRGAVRCSAWLGRVRIGYLLSLLWELGDKPLENYELVCACCAANLDKELVRVWPLQSEIGCALIADGTDGAKIRGVVSAAERLVNDVAKMKARSACWVVWVRLARYRAAHLASKAVAVENVGTGLLGNCALKSGLRCWVEKNVLAGLEVVTVVVGENLITLLGAKLAHSTRPLGDVSGHAAELVGVHDLPDVIEEVCAKVVSGSHKLGGGEVAGCCGAKRSSNPARQRRRHRRRKGIANLPIGSRLLPGKLPVIREALDAGNHANGEARHTHEILFGRFVGDAHTVNAERGPRALCARRAKVGAAMLLGTAYDGRRDLLGALAPRASHAPAACRKQIVERVADSYWRAERRRGPRHVAGDIGAERDENDAGPQLRNAVIGGVEQAPAGAIAKPCNLAGNESAVVLENRVQNAPDVLNHYGARLHLAHKTNRLRKKVALVGVSKLLAGLGKRRAGQASRQQVNARVGRAVEGPQILLDDVPMRAVRAQRVAAMRVKLHERGVLESGTLKAKRLPAGSGAKLNCGQVFHGASLGVDSEPVNFRKDVRKRPNETKISDTENLAQDLPRRTEGER